MAVNKLWLFQDESGEPGKSDFFITGYIRITSNEKNKLLEAIHNLRESEKFYDEFHYQKFSDFRARVYKKAIDETFKHNMYFKCIVVRKELVNIRKFGNQRHRAYNFFTKLVAYHGLKHRDTEHVHIRTDDKSRLNQDNFLTYLQDSLNYDSIVKGNDFSVRSVKPRSSDTCDMIQLSDLLLGAVKCYYDPALSQRKKDFSYFVLNHTQKRYKVNVWDWQPY